MARHPVQISRANLDATLNDLIANQRWLDFQRIAVPLARERCPDLRATEKSGDCGADALGSLPDGRALAVACSITSSWEKIRHDISQIKCNKLRVDVLWFYTPRGATTAKTDRWVKQAQEQFNIDLVVYPREEIIGQLLDPRHHYLIHHHLGLSNQAHDEAQPNASAVMQGSVFDGVRRLGRLDIYRVQAFHHWPYESTVSHVSVAPADDLFLSCNLVSGTKYRCHSSNSAQFISYGLVGHNFLDGASSEDARGNPLRSSNVALPNQLWIQVEYTLFHSTRRSDDRKISSFRRAVLARGIAGLGLSTDCAPEDVSVGHFNDPWFDWYEMQDAVQTPGRFLYISAIDNLLYVNAATIPQDEDFGFVEASIYDYRPYTRPPSYLDLFSRFDVYSSWFRSMSDE
jgi:hypothetical protein